MWKGLFNHEKMQAYYVSIVHNCTQKNNIQVTMWESYDHGGDKMKHNY